MAAWPRPGFFVGEPSGTSPNFIGESIHLSLPYWVRSWPMDYRPWISPQLYAPPTFAVYKENRDPAFEAVLGEAKR
jgi:hypothetical protein